MATTLITIGRRMAEDTFHAHDAAAAVLARHGSDALAFAAERLAFCRAADFAEGVILWSAVVDRITALTMPSPGASQARNG